MRKLNVINKGNSLDVSDELLMQKYHNGIRFINPESIYAKNDCFLSIADSLQLPLNLFIFDVNSTIQKQNEHHANACGLDSPTQYIGKSALDLCQSQSAQELRKNDMKVILNKKTYVYKENVCIFDKNPYETLCIKIPCYNENNKIIGLVGFSIVLGNQSISDFLINFLNPWINYPNNSSNFRSQPNINNSDLSPRQMQILKLVIRGKSSKDIGTLLNLSYRTVQHYLDVIKLKLNVASRSELIEKVIDDLI